ncbi:ribosomal protein S12 methylthiotransferase RimO [Candidatus Termititenax dinenymphae]|uniref:Ribosomal protein uS12 methylthiotransferase RimO n=1 Tax=Candidatus Termititenax dinenymphae TaxID=2218523 RepID=A0A388TKK2_9BACT|nr:ribosomal protein S12 methylthiotransferase RimO [Candidatus Termititenax dinenymphae]
MPSIFPISLGCPKNLTDTEEMLGILQARGYRIATGDPPADIALINTCAFIGDAVKESYAEIEKLLAMKKQGYFGRVIVAGCLVQREKAKLLKKYPEIDSIIGVGSAKNIVEVVDSGRDRACPVSTAIPRVLTRQEYRFPATLPHSAYLKIADGCNNSCAFCTIPRLRGGYRSKPINDIIQEAECLVAGGVREVSLVAQDTTSYGIDLYSEYRLADLLKALTGVQGLEWIRLMYAYPERVTPEIVQVMAENNKICHYLDMPLQHVSDKVLARMGRESTEKLIKQKIKLLRKFLPDIALRTNFIVGYPGESKTDFAKLKDFVEEYEFSKVGIFAYSREKGTKAAGLTGHLPKAVREDRCAELTEVQSRVIDRKNKKMIGKSVKVLMDMPSFGRTQYEAPDIDGGVNVTPRLTPGAFADVKITGADGYILKAEILT